MEPRSILVVHQDPTIDFRKHPELYKVGRGEQGVLMCQVSTPCSPEHLATEKDCISLSSPAPGHGLGEDIPTTLIYLSPEPWCLRCMPENLSGGAMVLQLLLNKTTIGATAESSQALAGLPYQASICVNHCHMQPFKAELLPLWRFKTEADAKKSAEAITARWRQYMNDDEFPGADLARKYLQMVGRRQTLTTLLPLQPVIIVADWWWVVYLCRDNLQPQSGHKYNSGSDNI